MDHAQRPARVGQRPQARRRRCSCWPPPSPAVRSPSALAGAGSAGASVRPPGGHAANHDCGLETAANVSKILGEKLGNPKATVNGKVTVCWYPKGIDAHALYTRFQTGDSLAGLKSDFALSKKYGEHPKWVTTFAPSKGFSSYVGASPYTSYDDTVLKGSTEIGVGAVGTTSADIAKLTKDLLKKV